MTDVPVEDITKLLDTNLNLGAEEPEKSKPDDDRKKRQALDLIKEKLKGHANCFNWIKDEDVFRNSALTVYKVISSKLFEIDSEDDATEIKYNALELISIRYIQVFLAVYLKKAEKIDLLMEEMKTHLAQYFKDKKYIPTEYVEGFEYALQSLKIYWDVESNDGIGVELVTLQNYLSTMPNFESLTIKGQVAVMSIKQCFWGNVYRKDFDCQIEVLQKIVKIDPGYFEWCYCLYNILRFKRRSEGIHDGSAEETALILKSAALAPDNSQVLVSKCMCLAEQIRSQPRGGGFALQFAGQLFMSAEHAEEYLREEITRILVLDPMSAKINITIAEMYSVVLPHWIRDNRLAKQCIERALLFHPNSSKANNRMGIYYLTVEKDFKMAQQYFQYSLEADQRNFPALIELLLTYSENLNENNVKIAELLEANLNNSEWNDDYLAKIIYQKGMIHFMKNEFQEAVNLWIEAYLKNKDATKSCIEKLMYFKNRYNWSQPNLEYSTMESVLRRTMTIGIKDGEGIKSELIKLVQTANIRDQARSSRGGRGGRGPSGGFGGRGNFGGQGGFGGGNRGGYRGGGFNFRGGNAGGQGDYNRKTEPPSSKLVDHHEILGVSKSATKAEIKKAYYHLCLKTHPDKNPNLVGAEKEANLEKMKKINAAYAALN